MIIPLLPDYEEGILPAEMEARIARHIEQCPLCQCERELYIEKTSSFIHSPALPSEYQEVSVSDRVMARILEENKWAAPTRKQDSGVSAPRRRFLLAVAAALLVLFTLAVVIGTKEPITAPASAPELAATDHIASIDQFFLPDSSKPLQQPDVPDMKYGIIASAGEPIVYRASSENGAVINYGLLSGIFGILVIVVGMGWLSRLKDKRK